MSRFLAALLLAATIAACGSIDEPDGAGGSGGTPVTITCDDPAMAAVGVPCFTRDAGLADLEPNTWNGIQGGGDTVCSDGTPYAFFVWPGATEKIVVDFMGGGACWDDLTCLGLQTFDPTVQTNVLDRAGQLGGLLNMTDPRNPIGDYTHVLATYCTGDIHWGDAVVEYGSGADAVEIHHEGAVNSRAMLDWVYGNFATPDRVLVTGCSAGSVGSILWGAHVQNHYPDARVVQFGDSFVGVITPEFRAEEFPSWNVGPALPTFLPEINPANVTSLELSDLYKAVAARFPELRTSQLSYTQDKTQKDFYTLMAGSPRKWNGLMLASLDAVHAGAPGFRSFVAEGTQHCVIPYDLAYDMTSGGVKFIDWITEIIEGEDPGNVVCAGDGCNPVN